MRLFFWKKDNEVKKLAGKSKHHLCYEVETGKLSDLGCCRSINQDHIGFSILARPNEVLAIVADGMGGHQAGEVASDLAVKVIQRQFMQLLKKNNPMLALQQAFLAANSAIYKKAAQPKYHGMGTTLVGLVIMNGNAYYANVGDSRLYFIRDNKYHQLSVDHTLIADLITKGLLKPEAVQGHPDQGVITRSVGTHPKVAVDSCKTPIPLCINDYFLLCSDGLHDLVNEDEMVDTLKTTTPQQACQHLIQLAKNRGGYDNITVIVLKIIKKSDRSTNLNAPVTRH